MFIPQRQVLDTGIRGAYLLKFLCFRPQFERKVIGRFQPFFIPFVLSAEYELRVWCKTRQVSNPGDAA